MSVLSAKYSHFSFFPSTKAVFFLSSDEQWASLIGWNGHKTIYFSAATFFTSIFESYMSFQFVSSDEWKLNAVFILTIEKKTKNVPCNTFDGLIGVGILKCVETKSVHGLFYFHTFN